MIGIGNLDHFLGLVGQSENFPGILDGHDVIDVAMDQEPRNLNRGRLRGSGFDRLHILHEHLGEGTLGFFPHASLVRRFLTELTIVKGFRVHHSGQGNQIRYPVVTGGGQDANGSAHAVTGISYAVSMLVRGGNHGLQVIHFL